MDSLYALGRIGVSIHSTTLQLDELKAARANSRTLSGSTGRENDEQMLLTHSSGKLIAQTLEIPELEVEIDRAVKQVERSLAAKRELEEEKQEIESATKEGKAKS